jgi:hypothetical protein
MTNTTKYRITLKSRNRKVGPIPVTTTEKSSCPSACPLAGNGCYADGGPLAIVWKQTETMGMDIDQLCSQIESLPAGQLWRMNQAGDLAHNDQNIDGASLDKLVKANRGKRGFTYTHHDMGRPANRDLMRFANQEGFTINLSGNNPAHADQLADMGIGPVVTVLPIDQLENTTTPAGRKITICPVVTGRATSCATCKLCAQANRKTIIGFPAHGMRRRAAGEIAKR